MNLLPIGLKVVATAKIYDEGCLVAEPGDMGVIVEGSNPFPTVQFKRTGASTIVDFSSEVSLVC